MLTATVTVTQRSLFGRVIRMPGVLREHYGILRRTNGRLVSLYAAWVFAGLVVKVK